MIRYIDKDPDYLKIGVSTLIRYKLQQKYGIKNRKRITLFTPFIYEGDHSFMFPKVKR